VSTGRPTIAAVKTARPFVGRTAGGRSYMRPPSQSTHRPTQWPGNYYQLVSLCLLPPRCMRLPLSMSPTAFTATESCTEYQLCLRGNYQDKDMPRYDVSIAIFDTIRYIVPSLRKLGLYRSTITSVCICASYANLAIVNRILNCVNCYIIRIINCQIRCGVR